MRTPLRYDSLWATVATAVILSFIELIGVHTASAASAAVGLWRFNEGSGTNVSDSSGFRNNGVLAGENSSIPIWATGQAGFGGALKFVNDGASHSYVDIPGSTSLQIGQKSTNAWAMTAWAYEDSGGSGDFVASYGRILVIDDGQAFQWESGASGDGQMYSWSRASTGWQIGWQTDSPVTPLMDQWVHWAVVYDGSSLTVYRNGDQGAAGGMASNAVKAALGYAGYSGAVRIGSELGQAPDRNWNGLLDDVALFNGVLTKTEIQTIMTGDFSAHLGGPAHIVTGPQSQVIQPGTDVTFQVGAQGLAPVSYRWFFNGTNQLPSISDTLTLTNVLSSQSGLYSVTVSNALAVETSLPALLIVNTNQILLAGLWRFDGGAGTNVVDSSGFNNNGVLAGENGNLPAWTSGQPGFGGALSFTNDGVNHAYVDIPGSSTLRIGQTPTNSWTITAWAYESSGGTGDFVSTYGRIVTLDDGQSFQWESGASGDAQMYSWSRADTGWEIGWATDSSVSPLLDQWVHWAVVYDGANLTVYRDGNQGPEGGMATSSVKAALGFVGYTGSIHIGSELGQPASRNWNGMLDDVALFNVALTPTQIGNVKAGDFSGLISRIPLSASVDGDSVILSWSTLFPGFKPQSSPSLSPAQWTDVSGASVQHGELLTLAMPINNTARFFRLVAP